MQNRLGRISEEMWVDFSRIKEEATKSIVLLDKSDLTPLSFLSVYLSQSFCFQQQGIEEENDYFGHWARIKREL